MAMLRAFKVGCLCGAIMALGSWPVFADEKSAAKDAKKVDLQVGDPAPSFEGRTDSDATWESSARFGKKWVVVYFYPGDFTPGCMAQANAFRDAMHKLTDKGVEVVGISGDSVRTHDLFKKAQKLNFTLLADEDGVIAGKFGVPFGKGGKVKAKDTDGKLIELERAGTASRWTYIVDKNGKIAYKNTKVTPADDAKKILEFLSKSENK